MEPITLCGAVILAVGLWEEFESIIMKVARVIFSSNIMTVTVPSPTEQRPLYAK